MVTRVVAALVSFLALKRWFALRRLRGRIDRAGRGQAHTGQFGHRASAHHYQVRRGEQPCRSKAPSSARSGSRP